MPASRRALAMTLAPRSWPSSPGFAMITRILCTETLAASNYRRFLVFPPDFPKRIAHFADGRIPADGFDEQRHRIGRAAGAFLEGVQGRADAAIVPRLTQPIERCQLPLGRRLVDVERANRLVLVSDELIDADDDLVALLDRLLELVGAFRDFPLWVAFLHSGNHPAHAID